METYQNGRKKETARYAKFLEPANVVLTIAVVLALAFLVVMSRRNIVMSQEYERLKKDFDRFGTLEVGDIVPSFGGTDLDGRPVNVDFDSARTHLLLIFSTSCAACSRQLSVWSQFVPDVTVESCTVHGISLDSAEETRAFLNGVERIPTLIPSRNTFVRAYRVRQVPQTILVSKTGVIEWIYAGILTDDKVKEILTKIRDEGKAN